MSGMNAVTFIMVVPLFMGILYSIKKMKPKNIFFVRHGQSDGNVDKNVYRSTPDYAIQLTQEGKKQAFEAGCQLAKVIDPVTPVQFYVSPFWRTRQTFIEIQKSFPKYAYYEDPRLREQEWGHLRTEMWLEGKIEEYRDNYGHFYYRFKDGESCADVYDRVSDFLNTLFRDFEKPHYPPNVIIVSHGMSIRLFMMRWFHCTVEEFESWGNPPNGGILQLQLCPTNGKYSLKSTMRLHKIRHDFQFDWEKTDLPSFGIPKLS